MIPIHLLIKGKLISKDNEKVFNKYGRPFTSKRFKDWASDVKGQAKEQYTGQPRTEKLSVTIYHYFPDDRRCDIGNAPKGLLDALTGIVWLDDKQIYHLDQMIMNNDKINPRTKIVVEEFT